MNKSLHIGWYSPDSKRFCYKDEKLTRPDFFKKYNIPVYTYSIAEIEKLAAENKQLKKQVDLLTLGLLQEKQKVSNLRKVLTELNEGFKHEYGHSNADQYNQAIAHWNNIAKKALKG